MENLNLRDGLSLYEFGQLFGILIALLGLFTYSSKKRGVILAVKGSTDVLSTVQQSIGSTPLFTWAGIESLLPMAGSVIMVFGFYSLNPHNTRILALFGHGLWLLYGIFHLNFGTILSNVIYITAAIIGLAKDYKAKLAAARP